MCTAILPGGCTRAIYTLYTDTALELNTYMAKCMWTIVYVDRLVEHALIVSVERFLDRLYV